MKSSYSGILGIIVALVLIPGAVTLVLVEALRRRERFTRTEIATRIVIYIFATVALPVGLGWLYLACIGYESEVKWLFCTIAFFRGLEVVQFGPLVLRMWKLASQPSPKQPEP